MTIVPAERALAGTEERSGPVRAATGRAAEAVERPAGGSKKGVYRVHLAGGGTVVAAFLRDIAAHHTERALSFVR